jgi:CRP/FNR family transcriptional regulator, cyclic AMP receptor protein
MAKESSNRVPDDLWNALRSIGKIRNFTKGTRLFSAEEPSKGVYLVEKGTIGVLLPSVARSGVYQKAGAGAVLGLSETMTGEDHKFTAEALEDSQTWFVERRAFLNYLRQDQLLCLQVIRLLSEDIHSVYHSLQCNYRSFPRARKPKS